MQRGLGQPSRLNSLTSLRFFAATLVVLYHSLPLWKHYVITYRLLQFGYLGVTFFFILSGFVLTYSSLSSPLNGKKFVLNRIARIWPLHIATLIVCIVGSSLCHAPIAGIPGTSFFGTSLNFVLLHAWIPLNPNIRQGWNGVSWTLSVEFMFYLAFPFMFRSLKRQTTKQLISLSVFLWVLYAIFTEVARSTGNYSLMDILWYFPPSRFPEFITGCVMAIILHRGIKIHRWNFARVLGLLLLPGSILIYASVTSAHTRFQAEANMIVIPAFAIIIWASACKDVIQNNAGMLARNRTILTLGQESFALYLLHAPLLGLFGYTLFLNHSLNNSACGGEILTVIYFLAALGLSRLVHALYELPVESRLRSIIKKRYG